MICVSGLKTDFSAYINHGMWPRGFAIFKIDFR